MLYVHLNGNSLEEITAEIKMKQNHMSNSVEHAAFLYYKNKPDRSIRATVHSSLLLNELSALLLWDRSASSEDSAHLRFIFGII